MKPQDFITEHESIGDDAHQMHKSQQHHMLREECYHSAANAIKLHQLLGKLPDGHELDAWAAEKISLANDYLKTVAEWLEYDVMSGERPHASGMTAFNMAEAEEKFAELLGESDAERAYVCVHAKKGQCEVTAKTSYEAARKAAAKWKLKNTAGVDAHLKDVKHQAVNEEQGVAEGNGPQSKIDQQIIDLLVKGVPAATIARKLDIPEEWVHEVHEYSMPEPSIDFSDPRNISPTNRFGEGVAEALGTSPDRLRARTGMNTAHKFPRPGQTDLGNIPGMNTPGASPETKEFADQQRARRSGDLKAAIKGQLGQHHKPNLPESGVAEATGQQYMVFTDFGRGELVPHPYLKKPFPNKQRAIQWLDRVHPDWRSENLVIDTVDTASAKEPGVMENMGKEDTLVYLVTFADGTHKRVTVRNAPISVTNERIKTWLEKEYGKPVAKLVHDAGPQGEPEPEYRHKPERYEVDEGDTPDVNYSYIVVGNGEETVYNSQEQARAAVKKLGAGYKIKRKPRTSNASIKKHHANRNRYDEQDVVETTGDPKFDKMFKDMTGKKAVDKQRTADRRTEKAANKAEAEREFGSMFGGGNPAANLGVKKPGVSEDRTETKDKDGNVVSWRDEGEWKKTNGKEGRGTVTRLSDRARRETEKLPTLDQELNRIAETFSSSFGTVFNPGSGPKTGSLFGGTYSNPDSPFAAKKKPAKKSSTIKR